jgi:hypothetical protein
MTPNVALEDVWRTGLLVWMTECGEAGDLADPRWADFVVR